MTRMIRYLFMATGNQTMTPNILTRRGANDAEVNAPTILINDDRISRGDRVIFGYVWAADKRKARKLLGEWAAAEKLTRDVEQAR